MSADSQAKKLKIIFLILLFVILFLYWFNKKQKNIEIGSSLDNITMDIDGWKGTNLTPSEKEKNWVDKGDLIIRSYQKDNNSVYLVAIQEKGDRHKVHSPQDCYSGSGWVILRKDNISIGDENNKDKIVRRMHVAKDNKSRLVYYWFTNGYERSTSFKGHLILFLRDILLKGSIRSWMCIQVSADIKTDADRTSEIMESFISQLDTQNR
ncbi:MAG: EpsI family protein [Deltaproteobacteria bacterium]|nr:EpsI family protein [Deltaproteobacteria bacterium]